MSDLQRSEDVLHLVGSPEGGREDSQRSGKQEGDDEVDGSEMLEEKPAQVLLSERGYFDGFSRRRTGKASMLLLAHTAKLYAEGFLR